MFIARIALTQRFTARGDNLTLRHLQFCGPTITIHWTPNRSVPIPNFDEKNVFVSGIVIWPPSVNAANVRSASASSDTVSASDIH